MIARKGFYPSAGRISAPLAGMAAIAFAHVAYAASLDTPQVLDLITKTADSICSVVSTKGETESTEVRGQVKAQLSGLAAKLADVGVSGTGGINNEQYQNVLRQDLASTLHDNQECKLKVFDTLQTKLLAPVSAATSLIAPQAPAANPAAQPGVTPQSSPTAIDVNQYSRKTCFDYSTNNGVAKVSLNAIIFEIRFSERDSDSIYVYKDNTNLRAIAALGGVTSGKDVNFAAFDSSSRGYWVPIGGFFIAQNMDGYFLLARILSIKAAARGASNDEVCFAYSIDASKTGKFKVF